VPPVNPHLSGSPFFYFSVHILPGNGQLCPRVPLSRKRLSLPPQVLCGQWGNVRPLSPLRPGSLLRGDWVRTPDGPNVMFARGFVRSQEGTSVLLYPFSVVFCGRREVLTGESGLLRRLPGLLATHETLFLRFLRFGGSAYFLSFLTLSVLPPQIIPPPCPLSRLASRYFHPFGPGALSFLFWLPTFSRLPASWGIPSARFRGHTPSSVPLAIVAAGGLPLFWYFLFVSRSPIH